MNAAVRFVLPTLACLAALAPPLTAQDGAKDSAGEGAQDPTQALLAGLTDYSPRLTGQSWFGIYLQGRKCIGALSLDVTKAAPESPGTYRAEVKLDLAFGPTRASQHEVSVLAADLGIVSRSGIESSTEGDESTTEEARVERTERGWSCTKTSDERTAHFSAPLRGPNHEGLASLILLCRSLDLKKPGTYTLSELSWPEIPDEGDDPEAPQRIELTLTLAAEAAYTHRGREVRAHRIRANKTGPDAEATVLMVDTRGRLLAFWPEGSPLRMILAQDEAEARRDAAPQRGVAPGSKTPEGACAVYILVVTKRRPPEALDSVLDWRAVHAWLKTKDPRRWGQLDTSEFRASLLEEFRASESEATEEQAKQFIDLLEAKVKGDTAEVNAPGLPAPFSLERRGESWKIVRFPG